VDSKQRATQVTLWGFHGTDVYSCVPADTLHQCFNGMTKHLFACLLDYVSEKCGEHKETVVCILRDRLSSYRRLHYGGRIPVNSLWAIKTCGEVRPMGNGETVAALDGGTTSAEPCRLQENEAIMRFIGIALYGLVEFGVGDEVVKLFASKWLGGWGCGQGAFWYVLRGEEDGFTFTAWLYLLSLSLGLAMQSTPATCSCGTPPFTPLEA
jgi:hypothetical protein